MEEKEKKEKEEEKEEEKEKDENEEDEKEDKKEKKENEEEDGNEVLSNEKEKIFQEKLSKLRSKMSKTKIGKNEINEILISKEDLIEKKELILRYIENGRKDDLINFVKSKITNDNIFNLTLGISKDTIIHKLIKLDNETLFFAMFEHFNSNFSEDEIYNLLNYRNENGDTLLLTAVLKGNMNIIKKLIKEGSNIYTRNYKGQSIMHMAAQGNNPNLLIYFKDKFKFDYLDKDNGGNTPLHFACYNSSEDSINFLLSWMDDINIKNNKGQNPLYYSIYFIKPHLIKKLISKGIDLNIYDNNDNINNNVESVIDIIKMKSEYNPEYTKLLTFIEKKNNINKFLYYENKSNNEENEFPLVKNKYFSILLFFIFEVIMLIFIMPNIKRISTHIIFYSLMILIIIVYSLLIKSDPGIIISNDEKDWFELVDLGYYINDYCPYCKIKKTVRVKHCFICNKCIEGFDHHFIFIDNCIGDGNENLFFLFCVSLLFNLIFCFYCCYQIISINSFFLGIFFIMIFEILTFIVISYTFYIFMKGRFYDYANLNAYFKTD